mmetsp:Transcript_141158/g.246090  ORF Transcript_141158/g.246090 Transcript_141158/m.246090 type:complete len:96 (+) Transcript_141158:1725-2012(+)
MGWHRRESSYMKGMSKLKRGGGETFTLQKLGTRRCGVRGQNLRETTPGTNGFKIGNTYQRKVCFLEDQSACRPKQQCRTQTASIPSPSPMVDFMV